MNISFCCCASSPPAFAVVGWFGTASAVTVPFSPLLCCQMLPPSSGAISSPLSSPSASFSLPPLLLVSSTLFVLISNCCWCFCSCCLCLLCSMTAAISSLTIRSDDESAKGQLPPLLMMLFRWHCCWYSLKMLLLHCKPLLRRGT